ncbi:MAG: cadherin-like domain-containing protein [Acidimicrobiia bacterium]|nr:cadherin-like domain-containing protein [Acidimicrobiia bacterium]
MRINAQGSAEPGVSRVSTVTGPIWTALMGGVRELALTAILLGLFMALVGVPARSAEPATGVGLDGYWRFVIDDDPSFADSSYDDSGWVEVLAPEDGGQYELDAVDAIAWFRQTFTLPEATADEPMWASMGIIDDADEVYINGILIGASGGFPPNAQTAFFHHRLYAIPDGILNFGREPNLIAVRVRDSGGGGGIARGPLGVFTRDEVRRELYGVALLPVGGGDHKDVREVIESQAAALKAGDLDAYTATLDPGFFHAGHSLDRQVARMDRVTDLHPGIDRVDEILEIGETSDGLLVAEVRRTWSDGGTAVAEEPGIAHAPQTGPDVSLQFLYFDAETLLEVGDRSRFFRDFVNSDVSNARREFDVFLPPSYFDNPTRRYPTVYVLHGAGGRNRQWEGVDLDKRIERLIGEGFVEEMIVVTPSGRTVNEQDTWYANTSVEQWRTMFFEDLIPQVDATYRTIDDRTQRGLTGWSMGGQGAFTAGWAGQHLFGSIASLSGALDFPPLAGSASDIAINAAETPNVQVTYRDPLFLRSYCYWLYAGEEDDYAFDEATRVMMAELAAKSVIVEAEIRPGGRHNGHTELPGLTPAFRLHSLAFDAHDDLLGCQATVPVNSDPEASDDAVETRSDQSVSVRVLANDSDVDHDRLRLTDVDDPAFGTTRIEFDGTIAYVPDPGFVGTDTFTYTITDGRAGTSTATVEVSVFEDPAPPTEGRVHGSGHWDDGVGYKVSFSFDAKVDKKTGLRGKLKIKDKDADVKIYAKEITSLGDGNGVDCNGMVLDGIGTFAFTARGDLEIRGVEVENAEFFACGTDNGKKGKGDAEHDPDTFFVEVTSGGLYATSEQDDFIDGGNVHLHDPIVSEGSEEPDSSAGGAQVDTSDQVMVIDLDPMFADATTAIESMLFTVVAESASGPAAGQLVTLNWLGSDDSVGEMTALTNALGVAEFGVLVPLGTSEFTASVGDLDSNPIWVDRW